MADRPEVKSDWTWRPQTTPQPAAAEPQPAAPVETVAPPPPEVPARPEAPAAPEAPAPLTIEAMREWINATVDYAALSAQLDVEEHHADAATAAAVREAAMRTLTMYSEYYDTPGVQLTREALVGEARAETLSISAGMHPEGLSAADHVTIDLLESIAGGLTEIQDMDRMRQEMDILQPDVAGLTAHFEQKDRMAQAAAAQTGKVETARKSIEAIDDPEWAELQGEVMKAAADHVYFHTDVRPFSTAQGFKTSEGNPIGGYHTFADKPGDARVSVFDQYIRRPQPSLVQYFDEAGQAAKFPDDTAEIVSFLPATQRTYEHLGRTETKSVGLLGWKKEVPVQDAVDKPILLADPAAGGREVPAKYFGYFYSTDAGNGVHPSPDSYLGRRRDDPSNPGGQYRGLDGREGNALVVQVLLPASLADRLEAEVKKNPKAGRELAEKMVLELGGITEASWNRTLADPATGQPGLTAEQAGQQRFPMRPPWENLPDDHPIYLQEPPTPKHQSQIPEWMKYQLTKLGSEAKAA